MTALVLALMLSACAPVDTGPPANEVRSARYVVEQDAAGERIIYRSRNGVVDRRRPIRTTISGWTPTNLQVVTCHSFKATQTSTGAQVCGMACTDGSMYRMPCDAEIFDGGFDNVFSQ
ncbi:MAG TPA: hypothetical protein VF689_10165 [Allosphingosinicella sp.]|jgi:hypothetical protein